MDIQRLGGGKLKGVVGGNKRGVKGKFRGVEGKLEELYGYVWCWSDT